MSADSHPWPETRAGEQRIAVVETHTEGEPTRVVVSSGPDLGGGTLAERRGRLRTEFDAFRAAVINEPRGSDLLVGALLCPPVDPRAVAGVIFFNNVDVLQMCGHGTIGTAVALHHLGRIGPGHHWLETPVGLVGIELHDRNRVTFENVPAWRFRHGVTIEPEGLGPVTGDVAWGGNWFFLADVLSVPMEPGNIDRLMNIARRIRRALTEAGITGADEAEIDHIELSGPPHDPRNDSRNFVLCPGGAHDRSPCGTGTSAKLACLAASGTLAPGDVFRQESIIGSLFEGQYRFEVPWATPHSGALAAKGAQAAAGFAIDAEPERIGRIIPSITGTAFVTGEATLILDPSDPYRYGIPLQKSGHFEPS